MKRLLLIGVLSGCLGGLTVNAQDEDADSTRQKPTKEQREARKDLITKYDTNQDGKLSKDERAAMSKEDKQALAKTGGVGKAGKGEKKEKKQKQEKKEKDGDTDQ